MSDVNKELTELIKKTEAPVMVTLYEKLSELFGVGNQLFSMEFPTRSLNPTDYEYKIENCHSTVSKPYVVQEAEFFLSNMMFDPSPILQGTNGEKLSTNYETIINNYVPKLKTLQNFVLDQKNIRAWLMYKIKDEINGVEVEQTRMAYAKDLYGKYLEEKNQWEKDKNTKYDGCKKDSNLEEYTRWLSSEGLVRDEQINNLYNDAVVRGFYHEVLTLLGFLNVSSPAEVLETTKQKMRASRRRSLDGSGDVYSVNFQPSNWFTYLQPNLNPKDLLSSETKLLEDYKNKKKALIKLNSEMSLLIATNISEEEIKVIEDKRKKAEEEYRHNDLEMIKAYGKNTVDAFKAALTIYKTITNVKEKITQDTKLQDMFGNIAESAIAGTATMFEKQQQLMTSMQEYSDLSRKYAAARASDYDFQISKYKQQIALIENDIQYLEPLLTGVLKEKVDNPDVEQSTGLVGEKTLSDDFTDIIISSETLVESHKQTAESEAKTKSWKTGFWIFSANHQSQTSSSTNVTADTSCSSKIEIGLRAKKISMERGGWFNPALFKISKDFYSLSENIKSNNNVTKSSVMNNFKELGKPIQGKGGLLPAFTTAFVVVKDVTIKIASSTISSEVINSYMKSNSSSSGGIFCFSHNTSSSSESKSNAAYTSSDGKSVYIRIPGPQIIGWFLEFTENDESEKYARLDPELYNDTGSMCASPNSENDNTEFDHEVEKLLNELAKN